MDTLRNDDLVNKGQGFADKAADKAQGGISEVKQGVNSAASSASNTVESARRGAGEGLNQAGDKAKGVVDTISDTARKAKDFAADTQDSVVSYTREQPVKALMIAAAAGAVLVTLIRALTPARGEA